jgi:RHS repeat-associated protein
MDWSAWIAEYAASGAANAPQKEYGYRGGQLLITAEPSGTVKWLVTDQIGSTRMVVDKSGALSGANGIVRQDYLPFGEEIGAGVGIRSVGNGYGTNTVRQKFGSKERDNETGLDYFGARYHSSVQGRFTTPDEFNGGPIELFAEVAAHNPTFYAEIAEPQSLNKYTYCLNNPLKYVDPDGHQTTTADRLKDAAVAVGQYVGGIAQGAASSLTYGLIGSPQPEDSLPSRVGQGVGSVLVGLHGVAVGVGGTALLDGPTLGVAELTAAPTVARAIGAYEVIGAAKNLGEVISKPMESRRRVGDGTEPTRADKKAVYDANRKENDGKLVCPTCGAEMVPARKSQRGVRPPPNEASIDHITPVSKSGSSRRGNLRPACRQCNRDKSDSDP